MSRYGSWLSELRRIQSCAPLGHLITEASSQANGSRAKLHEITNRRTSPSPTSRTSGANELDFHQRQLVVERTNHLIQSNPIPQAKVRLTPTNHVTWTGSQMFGPTVGATSTDNGQHADTDKENIDS
ncbi:predicted protein [Histoplasma capsulatum G186AR]|uniref:Uncharacterized protein n=2 Tax=Ajellomyces capsulatus TaxID=5037 RepID=C0NWZ2_AJECG|nr:uncharacterized protein HCBG_07984 [Histoplasma capsulatum G186AR]EEH03858.1 predicted protein [Histoplasma capsulatum G186AR]